VDELEIEIFNTYDEALLDYYLYDLCNESSLVFKIDFEVDSVLFAGDYYSAANSEYLINTYGDRLKLIRPGLLKHIWKALCHCLLFQHCTQ
jgi:hypothetical protein